MRREVPWRCVTNVAIARESALRESFGGAAKCALSKVANAAYGQRSLRHRRTAPEPDARGISTYVRRPRKSRGKCGKSAPGKAGQVRFVRSTLRAVPAKRTCPAFPRRDAEDGSHDAQIHSHSFAQFAGLQIAASFSLPHGHGSVFDVPGGSVCILMILHPSTFRFVFSFVPSASLRLRGGTRSTNVNSSFSAPCSACPPSSLALGGRPVASPGKRQPPGRETLPRLGSSGPVWRRVKSSLSSLRHSADPIVV